MRLLGVWALAFLVSGCLFGPNRGAKVLGYHAGMVVLSTGGRYAMGLLPTGWREWGHREHTLRFRHATSGAMITTGAYCGASFEDLPLAQLMGHLFAGLPPQWVEPSRALTLDGRPALRLRSRRIIDGVLMHYDAVMMKKHGCSFDFVLVAPPAQVETVTPAFETFVHGFRYE